MDTKTTSAETSAVAARQGETASGIGSYVQHGATWAWDGTQNVARWTADRVDDTASWGWRELKAHPYVGGALAGGVGLGAAMMVGVGELVVGVTMAYAGYLVLAKGESPMRALRQALALEHGER